MKNVSEKIIAITSASTVTLNITGDVEDYVLTGTKALSTNFEVVASATPTKACSVWIWCQATITVTGSPTFTVLGTVIDNKVIVNPFLAVCQYLNGGWLVFAANYIPVKGSGQITISSTGELGIKAKSILTGDLSDTAGVKFSQMEDLTADFLPKIGSDQKIAASDIPVADAEFIKGLTSKAQDQLDAIVAAQGTDESDIDTLQTDMSTAQGDIASLKASRTTDEANIAAAQVDIGNLQSAVAAIAPSKVDPATLSGTTVLVGASLKTDYYCDGTLGGFPVTLPAANTVAVNTMVKFLLVGASNSITIQRAGADNIILFTLGTATSRVMTVMGNYVWLVSDGSANWKLYSELLT